MSIYVYVLNPSQSKPYSCASEDSQAVGLSVVFFSVHVMLSVICSKKASLLIAPGGHSPDSLWKQAE